MKDLKVISCGTQYKHKKDFTFSQSTYPSCFLFLFFQTKFISYTKDGLRMGEPYSYILHPPYSKVYHTNVPESAVGFTNDWLYLKGSYIEKIVSDMNILTDIIVPAYSSNIITQIIQQIQREVSNDYIYKNEYIESLITNLFIELARNDNRKCISQSKNSYNIIIEARKTMMENYSDKWTLKSLSRLSGLSPSYFLSLYKRIYNKSPIDDIIDYRVLQSKFMLESGMMNVNEISTECGFSTPYYFSRIFKKKNGMSPTEYQSAFIQNTLNNS